MSEYPRCEEVLSHKTWRSVCLHKCTCYRHKRAERDDHECVYQAFPWLQSPAPHGHCPRTAPELSRLAATA